MKTGQSAWLLKMTNKMKVIIPRILTMNYHQAYDGGAKFFDYLSEYLVKKGIEVTIVTTPIKKGDYIPRFYNGVKYVFIPPYYGEPRITKINMPYKFVFSYNLLKYLKKEEFDILHSSESFALFYLMKQRRNPVVTQSFGLEPFYGPESLSQKRLKKIYVKLFLQKPWKFCLKKSELIGSEGEFQNEDLEKLGIERERITPIPNGINLEKIEKLKKGYRDKRKELGIKKKDLLILNVNQIAPDKRVEDIITAFSIIKRKVPNSKLVIIGKGPLEEKMRSLIIKFGLEKEIFHLKNIPDQELYNYYLSSDLFVNASVQKDFIMGIQEAMACGLPIVSSNQPFLVKRGENGYVVGSKNPEGIAEGIIKFYNLSEKERKKMGKASIKMAEQYDYSHIADTAIKEYKRLTGNKNEE